MRMKALLGGVGFLAFVMTCGSIVVSPPAQAQRWEDCHDQIRDAQWRLDRAVERWGWHSDEARHARHELDRIRDWCYSHHRDRWDPDWHHHDHYWH